MSSVICSFRPRAPASEAVSALRRACRPPSAARAAPCGCDDIETESGLAAADPGIRNDIAPQFDPAMLCSSLRFHAAVPHCWPASMFLHAAMAELHEYRWDRDRHARKRMTSSSKFGADCTHVRVIQPFFRITTGSKNRRGNWTFVVACYARSCLGRHEGM